AAVVLSSVGPTPMRAQAVEAALAGSATDEPALRKACASAADGLDPTPELNGSAEYKKHLAQVITRRALEAALSAGRA
ncbi:MAG TPA: xanthine dehydrogenase family protein subunit M, partial [Actinomycetota bacterium]|nr:xanthine dehydrogenase family protein subunit M [Actinomycetota bacterium]